MTFTNVFFRARSADAEDPRPLDEACSCPACTQYSRAYLHHLFKADEVLGLMLLSHHNIHYYQDLTRGARDAIEAGAFNAYAEEFRRLQSLGDVDPL